MKFKTVLQRLTNQQKLKTISSIVLMLFSHVFVFSYCMLAFYIKYLSDVQELTAVHHRIFPKYYSTRSELILSGKERDNFRSEKLAKPGHAASQVFEMEMELCGSGLQSVSCLPAVPLCFRGHTEVEKRAPRRHRQKDERL